MKTKSIFGPPGTGKTHRMVDIAGKEAAEHGVLYLSYTRAAAQEATSRITGNVKASTIHSLAFNALGMSRASVVDKVKLAQFGEAAGIPFMGSEDGSDEPQEGDEFINVLAFSNNRMCDVWEAWDLFNRPGTQHRFEIFLSSYLEWKKTYGFMDFDDMIQKFTQMPVKKGRWPVVLLDEAQDCSPMQWAAFRKIITGAERVYIAGDDDQAIYEWNGADPHGMIDFATSTGGDVEILDQSFRVPRLPYDLAHSAALAGIQRRVEKVFKPRDAEGSITRYGEFYNMNLERVDKRGAMVLVRDKFRMQDAKSDLNRLNIPYNVLGGVSPWTSKIANALRRGEDVDIPLHWRSFYRNADLRRPVNVTLSTIHQAKGREHKTVIVDLTLSGKALLDIHKNPDAERRVLYVALTRTSDQLHLCGSNPLL